MASTKKGRAISITIRGRKQTVYQCGHTATQDRGNGTKRKLLCRLLVGHRGGHDWYEAR